MALPETIYIEMVYDYDDDTDEDGSIFPVPYPSLLKAASGNFTEPATIGTYRLVETTKVISAYEVVK